MLKKIDKFTNFFILVYLFKKEEEKSMSETLQELYLELLKRPKDLYVCGKSHLDLVALEEVEKLVLLTEQVWKLYHMPGLSKAGIDYALLSMCLSESLQYASRAHFDLSIGFSEPDMWVGRSKESIIKSYLKHPNATEHLYKSIKYLERILTEDLKAETVCRQMYLILLTTCYRVISDVEMAIQYACEFTETMKADSFELLSQCYYDAEKYDLAIQTATKAIEHSGKNTADELGAWRNRAGIYSKIGKDLEASRDLHRVNELTEILEQRFSRK